MKKNLLYKLPMILLIVCFINSCWDDTTYRDTVEYPGQLIYLPSAIDNNQFIINDLNRIRGQHPVEGNPYRYEVDVEKNEFRVPLSVYRSGINNKGSFVIDIITNNKIISKINEDREDPYVTIPHDKYSLVDRVEMKDGDELARFNLVIDLDYLLSCYPDKILSVGIEISSEERETNPELSKTAIVIDSKIAKPTADFSYSVDTTQGNLVNFNNMSLMAASYKWDFGDGSEVSDEESPSHNYPTAGKYNVTLTALGLTGEQNKSTMTVEITIPE
jgi:hypothetical protein